MSAFFPNLGYQMSQSPGESGCKLSSLRVKISHFPILTLCAKPVGGEFTMMTHHDTLACKGPTERCNVQGDDMSVVQGSSGHKKWNHQSKESRVTSW